MSGEDTLYRCTVCGKEGSVGRCCGDDTRIPVNDAARAEHERMKTKGIKLKGCPFCGHAVEMNDYNVHERFSIECPNCPAYMGHFSTVEGAIASWNARFMEEENHEF